MRARKETVGVSSLGQPCVIRNTWLPSWSYSACNGSLSSPLTYPPKRSSTYHLFSLYYWTSSQTIHSAITNTLVTTSHNSSILRTLTIGMWFSRIVLCWFCLFRGMIGGFFIVVSILLGLLVRLWWSVLLL